jgi:hypothetical protein
MEIFYSMMRSKGYLYDLKEVQGLILRRYPGALLAAKNVYNFNKFGDEVLEIKESDPQLRWLIHRLAEALDIFHVRSLRWTVVSGDYSPNCHICDRDYSRDSNIATGVILSKAPIMTSKRDRKSQQRSYKENKEYAHDINYKGTVLRPNRYSTSIKSIKRYIEGKN